MTVLKETAVESDSSYSTSQIHASVKQGDKVLPLGLVKPPTETPRSINRTRPKTESLLFSSSEGVISPLPPAVRALTDGKCLAVERRSQTLEVCRPLWGEATFRITCSLNTVAAARLPRCFGKGSEWGHFKRAITQTRT